jgi:cell division protein FtsB
VRAVAGRRAGFHLPRLGVGPQIVVLVLVIGLVGAMAIQPTRQLLEQRRRIEGMAADLQRIEAFNEQLETRIARLQDPDYIEQQARAVAGLVRPGESTFVVMPPARASKRNRGKGKEGREAAPARPAEPGLVEGFLEFVGIQ